MIWIIHQKLLSLRRLFYITMNYIVHSIGSAITRPSPKVERRLFPSIDFNFNKRDGYDTVGSVSRGMGVTPESITRTLWKGGFKTPQGTETRLSGEALDYLIADQVEKYRTLFDNGINGLITDRSQYNHFLSFSRLFKKEEVKNTERAQSWDQIDVELILESLRFNCERNRVVNKKKRGFNEIIDSLLSNDIHFHSLFTSGCINSLISDGFNIRLLSCHDAKQNYEREFEPVFIGKSLEKESEDSIDFFSFSGNLFDDCIVFTDFEICSQCLAMLTAPPPPTGPVYIDSDIPDPCPHLHPWDTCFNGTPPLILTRIVYGNADDLPNARFILIELINKIINCSEKWSFNETSNVEHNANKRYDRQQYEQQYISPMYNMCA